MRYRSIRAPVIGLDKLGGEIFAERAAKPGWLASRSQKSTFGKARARSKKAPVSLPTLSFLKDQDQCE